MNKTHDPSHAAESRTGNDATRTSASYPETFREGAVDAQREPPAPSDGIRPDLERDASDGDAGGVGKSL